MGRVARKMPASFLKHPLRIGGVFAVALVAACAGGGTPAPASARYSGLVPGTIGVAVGSRESEVVVTAVRADGAAARAGVRAGDRIRSCNGEAVTSTRQFERMVLDARPGSVVRLEIAGEPEPRTVVLPVEEISTAVRM